jgi:hypothetical protein
VVAKIRERIAVNKQTSYRLHMDRFNLKKLNNAESKEQYHVDVSKMSAALEDLDAEVDISSAWKTVKQNFKMSAKEILGYYELKQHKPWFDEGCSELLDKKKQAKFQWLQDPSEVNGYSLKNVSHEASRHFRNKRREYLKDRTEDVGNRQ